MHIFQHCARVWPLISSEFFFILGCGSHTHRWPFGRLMSAHDSHAAYDAVLFEVLRRPRRAKMSPTTTAAPTNPIIK